MSQPMSRRKVVASSPTLERELQLSEQGFNRIAGVDEAGRGPLAGPVVAAAVVLPAQFSSPHSAQLHDSKQLTAQLREVLYQELVDAVQWGVGIVDAATIDTINIRQASWRAMQLAVADLEQRANAQSSTRFSVDYVLIDGLSYGAGPWPYEAIVKGDSKSLSIAAASVIAKETRDRLMTEVDAKFPQYGFAQHKGYGTPAHLRALKEHGACELHRQTFRPVRAAMAGTQ